MDERIYEVAIRGDVQKLLHLLNEDANMQAAEPLLDRVMRECSGKDNPMHLGALFGHVEFVREISNRKPEFSRQLNSLGLSPLHLAAERGHVPVVKVLLETDAGVCFVRDRDGRIPLHLAAIKGRVEVIEELVNAKNITAWLLTDEREPILHLCAKHDQFEALKKLVTLVKDHEFVRLRDSSDNTILHLLSAKKQIKEDWVLCRVFYKDRGTSPKLCEDNSSDDTDPGSSLPPLMDTFLTFDQTPPSLEAFEQVPCFSNFYQSPTTQTTNPTLSTLPQVEPTMPTKSLAQSSVLPDLTPFLDPISYEKEVIMEVLEHFNKMESNSKMLELVSSSLAEGSYDSYLPEMGLPSIWNESLF